MYIFWGIVLILAGLLAWLGQLIAALAPQTAARWGLADSESDVDPVFFADGRGEALWDSLTLWTLPAAGLLLLLRQPTWAYFGLIAGGMYLYFAGRGIFARLVLNRRKVSIGSRSSLFIAYLFLSLWGLIAAATLIAALYSLTGLK